MEIIKVGSKLEWIGEIDCDSCGSKLHVTEKDIYAKGNWRSYHYATICIACQEENSIKIEIPQHVINKILKRGYKK